MGAEILSVIIFLFIVFFVIKLILSIFKFGFKFIFGVFSAIAGIFTFGKIKKRKEEQANNAYELEKLKRQFERSRADDEQKYKRTIREEISKLETIKKVEIQDAIKSTKEKYKNSVKVPFVKSCTGCGAQINNLNNKNKDGDFYICAYCGTLSHNYFKN